MNNLFTLVMATGLLAGAGFVSYGGAAVDRTALPAPVAEQQISSPDKEAFRLRSSASDTDCTAVRGAMLSAGQAALSIDSACAALLPGMERAKFWHEQDDGSVVFTENGVDAIVTFMVADGAAYESVRPALPIIALDFRD